MVSKLICIAGTSSAGKSSVSTLLKEHFEKKGKSTKIIAVDDIGFEFYNANVEKQYWGDWLNKGMAIRIDNTKADVMIIDTMLVDDIIKSLKKKYDITKVLLYASPEQLLKNVRRRQKKDWREIRVVYRHFYQTYTRTNGKGIDKINMNIFEKSFKKRKHEFFDERQLKDDLHTIYRHLDASKGVISINPIEKYDHIIKTDDRTLSNIVKEVKMFLKD